jgi:hypothetical protein
MYYLVKSVTLPEISDVPARSAISVCFERGAKMVSSQDHELPASVNGLSTIDIRETLTLVATLYRNGAKGSSNASFQV